MRRLPPLSAVRVFEAAARSENFTRAAGELGMTQAAVSYQIRLLEERLSVPLFVREKGRVRLSDAGHRIAPLVSGAFDALAGAFSELAADAQGVLAISTTVSFATCWLAPRLGSFQIARPDFAVRLKIDNRLIDFMSDDSDVAIRTGAGDWPGLRIHPLFTFEATPMFSPGFLRQYALADPEDLLNVPRLGGEDGWWQLWFEQVGIAAPAEDDAAAIWFDSQVMEGNAAMAGHGAAMLSPILWRNELEAGRLVAPFQVARSEGVGTWLVYPEHKRNQPKVRAFRDWLLAEVAHAVRRTPADAAAVEAEARARLK